MMTNAMQRRDTYRIPIPHSVSTRCFIRMRDGSEVMIAVIDISVGGIGLIGFSPDVDLQEGNEFTGCRLELPGIGAVHCKLLVGRQSEITLDNGIKTIRTGCKFAQLSSQNENLLQRFIYALEQEANK
ncbi:flagellar brake protein [Chitinibacter sp. GC72]|uniref:flagellar brake protein n=1 Tax=Chitinibacter sp. GC72 TaxID=1526917 RepID=UPI0012FACFA9|nr:PilZ domain-containing protein [Chitinibacter sp. GC72]